VTAVAFVLLGACGDPDTEDPPAAVLPGEDAADLTTPATPAPTTTIERPTSATLALPVATTAPPTTPAPTVPPTTPAPTLPPTTAAPVTLPTPQAPPPERSAEPEVRLGRISIPKLGVDEVLFQGVTLTTLDKGPGHWPGTALPGQLGNVVVAGHRVSHSKPFRYIDRLVAGDEVVFTTDAGTFTYVVTGHEIVPPTAVRIIEQTAEHKATLFACHPPGSTRYRWVTYLALKT
jgi:sortase A